MYSADSEVERLQSIVNKVIHVSPESKKGHLGNVLLISAQQMSFISPAYKFPSQEVDRRNRVTMEVSDIADIDVVEDLKTAAVNHIRFLCTVNETQALYEGPVLQRAIWRYKHFWLPLASENGDQVLSAPLDIEWAWHCHLLSPIKYQEDCIRNYKTCIFHKIFDQETYVRSLKLSEKYWKQKYPDQPFSVSVIGSDYGNGTTEWPSFRELSCNIAAAALQQKEFYYQVSLPHYLDGKFLDKSIERYKKFLFLKKKYPNITLVPSNDIDLIWHIHLNFPASYKTVTELMLGSIFDYDASFHDRRECPKLNMLDSMTRHCWKTTFNEHFVSYGAMYRGDSPSGKLTKISEQENFNLVSKLVEIKFDNIEVQGKRRDSLGKFKLHITEKDKIVMCSGRYYKEKEEIDISEKLITLKGPETSWNRPGSIRKSLHCLNSDNLHLQLAQKHSWFCCGRGSALEGKFNLNALASKFTEVMTDVSEIANVDIDDELSVAVDMNLTLDKLGTCDLWLVPGIYEDCVMPEMVEQLWGPVSLPRLPPGVENKCSVSSHRLKNYKCHVEFTCRVVHSLPLMMSVVQVFYHDKMVVTAHVIGSDQLPKPEDVADLKICVTLDPQRGERALIIKNSSGDWGILIGRWDGYRRSIPPKRGSRIQPGRQGIPGNAGYLNLLFYKIKTKQWDLVSLEGPYASEKFCFNISDARVDLKLGKISIKGEHNEIAEHLALTFCVSLLHVLLQPRPENWEPGQPLEPQVNAWGFSPARYVKSDSLALILAAGLLIATPSNQFIRKTMKDRAAMFRVGGGSRVGNVGVTERHNERHENDVRCSSSVFGRFGEQNEGRSDNVLYTHLLRIEDNNKNNEEIDLFAEKHKNNEGRSDSVLYTHLLRTEDKNKNNEEIDHFAEKHKNNEGRSDSVLYTHLLRTEEHNKNNTEIDHLDEYHKGEFNGNHSNSFDKNGKIKENSNDMYSDGDRYVGYTVEFGDEIRENNNIAGAVDRDNINGAVDQDADDKDERYYVNNVPENNECGPYFDDVNENYVEDTHSSNENGVADGLENDFADGLENDYQGNNESSKNYDDLYGNLGEEINVEEKYGLNDYYENNSHGNDQNGENYNDRYGNFVGDTYNEDKFEFTAKNEDNFYRNIESIENNNDMYGDFGCDIYTEERLEVAEDYANSFHGNEESGTTYNDMYADFGGDLYADNMGAFLGNKDFDGSGIGGNKEGGDGVWSFGNAYGDGNSEETWGNGERFESECRDGGWVGDTWNDSAFGSGGVENGGDAGGGGWSEESNYVDAGGNGWMDGNSGMDAGGGGWMEGNSGMDAGGGGWMEGNSGMDAGGGEWIEGVSSMDAGGRDSYGYSDGGGGGWVE